MRGDFPLIMVLLALVFALALLGTMANRQRAERNAHTDEVLEQLQDQLDQLDVRIDEVRAQINANIDLLNQRLDTTNRLIPDHWTEQ